MIALFFFSFLSSAQVSPETSLRWLINGNSRFNKSYVRQDGQSGADVARLASKERPHAVVLSCGDSRVPPELVFDQRLGELFTVRNLGPTLDAGALKGVEHGVELGARLVVVLGHTSCEFAKDEWTNAESAARELQSRLGKKVWVVPAVYDLKTGAVEFRKK